ncbi:hypothetical protein Tco_0273914 [Tanacetum coccineum]
MVLRVLKAYCLIGLLREKCVTQIIPTLAAHRRENAKEKSRKIKLQREPRRRSGDRYSRSPSPHASVFKRLRRNRSLSPRPRPRKEGGVFNRLGRKEPATSTRPGSRQRSPQAKRTEVESKGKAVN